MSVGERFVRLVVNFDEQTISADGDGGAGESAKLCGACRCRGWESTKIGRWLRFF